MQIGIYSRDNGVITYRGEQDWESPEQVLEHYCRNNTPGQPERVIGWPHNLITWHGDTGIAQ